MTSEAGAEAPPEQYGGAVCYGVSWWNRRAVSALISGGLPQHKPSFTKSFDDALNHALTARLPLIAWASKLSEEDESRALAKGISPIRIEDGFLRSAGLGAGLASGASYAIDKQGIYYDARRRSALERLLESRDLTADEMLRGQRLRKGIIKAGLSKYNVGRVARLAGLPPSGPVILVPGQVANDAAVKLSLAPECLTRQDNINLSLLRAARARNPGAFIIYKPHPDVETGLRPGRIGDGDVLRYANTIARGINITPLLSECTAVETLSSLAGFEALLRGKSVTCHGVPFYAGWGLTEDLVPLNRRTRKRTIDELVFIAFVLYCRHINPLTGQPCSPEELISSLDKLKRNDGHRFKMAIFQRASWLGRKLGF